MDTRDYRIDGKPGTWLACDDVILDGRHFFLMQNEQMKNAAACAVVDENGKLVVDAAQKFDEDTLRQINEHLHPPQAVQQEPVEKPPLETWQKAFENGEYLRTAEMTEEQSSPSLMAGSTICHRKREKRQAAFGVETSPREAGSHCGTLRKNGTTDGS